MARGVQLDLLRVNVMQRCEILEGNPQELLDARQIIGKPLGPASPTRDASCVKTWSRAAKFLVSWSLEYKFRLLRIKAIALPSMMEGPNAWLPELEMIDKSAALRSNEKRWKCILSATRLFWEGSG